MDAANPALPSTAKLFDHAACGLLLTTSDGTIVRINATACRWLGYEPDALISRRRIQDLFTMGGRVFHQTHCIPLLQVQGSVSEVQIDLIHHDQHRIPMLMNVSRVREGEQLFDQFALFIATDRRSYERELIIARKSAENSLEAQRGAEARLQELNQQLSMADRRKDEFLAMLAHELRNPLAPISAAATVLGLIHHDDPRVRKTTAIIARQVTHMTSLINDLLDVSRVNSGMVVLEKQLLDMNQVVDDALEQVRPMIDSRRHQVASRFATPLSQVSGDRKRLVQIIANLLQNAAKYTPEGGAIALDISQTVDAVCVTVSDNGIGIDPELAPHIFDLFTQEKRTSDRSQGGLGLGLALVKNLTALHGGHISVASDGIGKGATFRLSLPCALVAPSAPGSSIDLTSRPIGARSLRLLVVDDNVDAANALAMVLEAAGHQVAVEHDPEAALQRAARDAPHVCVLDIGLPGMDGNELARRLRMLKQTAGATLIAVTGYGQKYDRADSISAGFDHYFVKPADSAELVTLLRKLHPSTGFT